MNRSLLAARNCSLPLAAALIAWCLPAWGAAEADAGAAAAPAYKIISDSRIIFQAEPDDAGNIQPALDATVEDITPCLLQDAKEPKYACADGEIDGTQPVYRIAKVTKPDGIQSSSRGLFELTFPAGTFSPRRLYRLIYRHQAPDPKTPGKTTLATASLSVDTSPTVTLSYEQRSWSLSTSGVYLFQLASPLGFEQDFSATSPGAQAGKHLTGARPADCQGILTSPGSAPITLTSGKDKTGANPTSLQAWIAPLSPVPSTDPNSLRLGQVGVAYVCVALPLSVTEFTPDSAIAAAILKGVESTLGKVDWALAPSSKFTLAPPAAASKNVTASTQSKSDASFYANLNIAAGTGAKLAWGLDGKIAELPRPLGPFFVTWLSAAANTGNNTANIKGQTYTDTIDWTLPLSYFYSDRGSPRFNMLFTAAPDYETDIEFDKRNMLVALDTRWSFARLYQTQSKRTPLENGALVTYPYATLNKFGYVLQFHGGVETGGALINTVQKATSGSATETVPTYSIARAVPQIRGLLQWIPARPLGLLTFDDTFAGRYLFATENTVQQFTIPATAMKASSIGLRLRPIDGWKALNSLTSTWYPPQNSHVGITATYNEGFNAPKFTRVNSVLIGVTIIY